MSGDIVSSIDAEAVSLDPSVATERDSAVWIVWEQKFRVGELVVFLRWTPALNGLTWLTLCTSGLNRHGERQITLRRGDDVRRFNVDDILFLGCVAVEETEKSMFDDSASKDSSIAHV